MTPRHRGSIEKASWRFSNLAKNAPEAMATMHEAHTHKRHGNLHATKCLERMFALLFRKIMQCMVLFTAPV